MTDRFPESFLDDLRAAVPITTVVGQHVTWDNGKSNPGRRDMWANCPFHAENSPSFHAQDEEGAYHCFGCGASGDHFAFLMALNGLSFPDAVAEVAALAGIALPEGAGGERKLARPPEQPRQTKERPQPSAADIRAEIVKIYDYTDRDGGLLYQVVRMQKKLPDGTWARTKDGKGTWKTFLQRRPADDGKWIWSLSAGEFLRRPGGDWRVFDRDKFVEGMETRFFDAGAEQTIYRHPAVEVAIAEGKPVLIVEGEKDADTTAALGFCGTTNSSGSKHWTDTHAANFRDADVVICLDNDAAGDRADKLAKSLKGIARRIRVLDFAQVVPGFTHKGDITDWVEQFGGNASKLGEILNTLPDYRPKPPASKFGAVSIKDAGKAATRHEWLVQDLIELHGTAAFSGYSQSGKSFQMIELAFAVAIGRKFWGRDTKQGVVVYQVGEGEEGFMKRVEGYLKDRGIDDPASVPIVILPKKINLFQSDDDATNLIAEAKAWAAYWDMPLRMIVIDTYNKATRGANEISGQDIGKINERLERIQTECQCNVTVVDHLSKGGTVRGHGSKTDDVNNMIRVEKDEKKVDRNGRPIRRMRLDKNKDGENGGVIEFVLRQVVVGFTEDGKAITTCVVEAPHGSEEELERSGRLPLNQSLILQTIRDVISRDGTDAPSEVKDAGGRKVAPWKAIIAELRRKWIYKAPETEPEQRERELQRIVADAGKRLQVNGYIDRDNTTGIVWWTGKTDRPLFKAKPAEPPLQPGAGIPEGVKTELANMDVPF